MIEFWIAIGIFPIWVTICIALSVRTFYAAKIDGMLDANKRIRKFYKEHPDLLLNKEKLHEDEKEN